MTIHDLISCALVGLSIAGIAYWRGFTRGRDFGWTEGYFEREAAERRKRDQFGRFKHVAP